MIDIQGGTNSAITLQGKAIIEKEALDDNDEDQKNQIHKDANEAH